MPPRGKNTLERTIALLRPHAAAGAVPATSSDRENPTTPPVDLLETAAAVRGSDRLTAAASLRLALVDGAVDPAGTRGAVSRILELQPDAVVLGAEGADAPRALREAGQQLAARRRGPEDGPLRVALLEDDCETAEQLLREFGVEPAEVPMKT